MSLSCEQPDIAGLLVRDGAAPVAEIRSLRMILARFRPGGKPLLSPTVPLPLFWMQYAHHEDPNRNAGSNAELNILRQRPDEIVVQCSGTTASGACRSIVNLYITRIGNPIRYRYTIAARLDIVAESGWPVTPNPDHGEVEFANLWPDGTFVTTPEARKCFRACYLVGRSGTFRIPHHHLESADKHLIPLGRGDRLLWALEDENPCFTLESHDGVSAGICAYMWDAHFGYKVADAGQSLTLPRGATFEAVYSLSAVDRSEAEKIIAGAQERPAPERGPLYVDGVNRFSETLDSIVTPPEDAWPWEKEGQIDAVLFVDRGGGYDDAASLCIHMTKEGRATWKFTALGPAYGRPAFADGVRFRFSAYVMADGLAGKAVVGLRLHREGKGSVFDLDNYELFTSADHVAGTTGWTRLDVTTSAISPAPDRVHLLLLHEGVGKSWFDNALLEVL